MITSFGLFLISIVIFVVIGASLILIYASSTSTPPPPARPPGASHTTSSSLIPDCFSPTTVSANLLYQILTRYKLEIKYNQLATAYSLILCANDNCDRIPTLLDKAILVGGSPNSAAAKNMVGYYTRLTNNDTKKARFLTACMDLIKNNMALLINDSTITEQDRSAAKGFNYEFCRKYFDEINRKCPDFA
jgi:ABC-type transport system involved in multi-copper enzyme maturation permease subunit